MSRKFQPLMLLAVLALLNCSEKKSAETEFWIWFSHNDSTLFQLEQNRENTLNQLQSHLAQVNSSLTFEFGPINNGKRDFVISADGLKSAFPAVERLYQAAPDLEHWNWKKFRQRQFPIADIEFQGKQVNAEDVRFLLAKDDPAVGILVFFKNYSEAEKEVYAHIGFLLLDQALGEYDVETKVGFIEFLPFDSEYLSQSYPLDNLPSQFDRYWQDKSVPTP